MTSLRTGSRLAHNGVQYLLDSDPGRVTYRTGTATNLSPKIFSTSVSTDASGAVSIGLPTGYFTTINYVSATAIRDTASPTLATFAMVRSYTLSAVAVQCFESKTTGMLIGGVAEGMELTTAAVVVMLMVIGV